MTAGSPRSPPLWAALLVGMLAGGCPSEAPVDDAPEDEVPDGDHDGLDLAGVPFQPVGSLPALYAAWPPTADAPEGFGQLVAGPALDCASYLAMGEALAAAEVAYAQDDDQPAYLEAVRSARDAGFGAEGWRVELRLVPPPTAVGAAAVETAIGEFVDAQGQSIVTWYAFGVEVGLRSLAPSLSGGADLAAFLSDAPGAPVEPRDLSLDFSAGPCP